MKSLIHFVVTLGTLLMLAGCHDEPPSSPPPRAVPRTSSSRPVPPSAEMVARSVDLEKRVEVERQLRLGTETRLTEQETSKSRWQVAALVAACSAEILLIVGAILGTRARHDAKK